MRVAESRGKGVSVVRTDLLERKDTLSARLASIDKKMEPERYFRTKTELAIVIRRIEVWEKKHRSGGST